ncbi:Porin [Chromobacterium violaceum]|uniref:porin n=1 Tax=Chromobacterium violaceum TaxID=536 RepID=UPI0009DB4AE6|nr:porin [Chromobacterium violaceum]MBP4049985.1 porin [Chromobacterium violaceum]OQS25428.1 porin [Chromobacterium violaceum]OQS45710.1 porin [Chromobacterium violaceum]OQS49474.1 porin [Chromobacterium violaceum]QRO34394.1 porin [Chromobacterium violaceum]
MQKKNLAAIVASLFIVPVAAHADVTIYGFLSGGIESAKATGNGTTEYSSRTRIVDHNSRIGFKGWEDIGGGTKAIWQVESSLRNFEQGGTNDKGQTATFATRNTFIGVDNGDFGKVLLGQNDSAYKMFTGSGNSALGTDVMINTTADNFGSSSVNSRGEARLANSIHWFSPNWAGFKLGASWGVDELRVSGNDSKRLSLGLGYTWGNLNLATAWDRQYDMAVKANTNSYNTSSANDPAVLSKNSGKNVTFYSIAASYKFDTGTFVGGNYEWGTFDQVGGGQVKQDDWQIALGQDFGAASVKLAYGQLGSLKNVGAGVNGDDFKAKQWILGGTYNLSKTTQLLAYYTKIDNRASAKANFANNPVYSSGIGTSDASLAAGNDPQAFGIGMKVSF